MIYKVYRLATIICTPLIICYLHRRKKIGKEDDKRINERFGLSTISRPPGRLIWLHAASVGEAISALELINKLLTEHLDTRLMMTTGTVSSAKLIRDRLPKGAFHQFIPIDMPNYVRRFMEHWQPNIVLWTESEFWPNIIIETRKRNIPMVLINGRISAKSFARWKWAPGLIKSLLQSFTLCLGQSDTDVHRLNKLGAFDSKNLGNLKFAAPPLPADGEVLKTLKSNIGKRPIFLSASTHSGEEEILAIVHNSLKSKYPNILSIIIPRHPDRGPEILRAIQPITANCLLRSNGDIINDLTDIYVVDTMGELGLFYRLSEIAFLGKSLVPLGGQNPIEALQLNCAVIHGPYMTNFQWMSEEMTKLGCSIQINNSAELIETVSALLSNNKIRLNMISNGQNFVKSHSSAVKLVAEEINKILVTQNAGA